MFEDHEILCPSEANCEVCQSKVKLINQKRAKQLLFGTFSDHEMESYHFYKLNISRKPSRTCYHRFDFQKFINITRELMNSLSSVSSVSNRSWFNLFTLGGLRYISIFQNSATEFPEFNHHMILISKKDNLDVRLSTQLKFRLFKIDKYCTHNLIYLGNHTDFEVSEVINEETIYFLDSETLKKLRIEMLDELNKCWYQKLIPFGRCFKNKNMPSIIDLKEEIIYV